MTQEPLFDPYGYEPAREPGATSGHQADVALPVAPSASPLARHASATGAQAAAAMASHLMRAYLAFLDRVGSATDKAAAAALRVDVGTINSTRNRLRRDVGPSGRFETVQQPSGRTTKRNCYRRRTPAELDAYDAEQRMLRATQPPLEEAS